MNKIIRLLPLAVCLLLASCWVNTAGRIFDTAGHKAVSEVSNLKPGDKLYCRNGEYYLCLPRYRVEYPPAMVHSVPIAVFYTPDKPEVRWQMFRVPAAFASYLCGGAGTPDPDYMEPVWDLSRLHNATGRAIVRTVPGKRVYYVDADPTGPSGAKRSVRVCNTADLQVGGTVMSVGGSHYISLPTTFRHYIIPGVPESALGEAEGDQWFRIPEDYARYLMGGNGADKPSFMEPVKGSMGFSEQEARTVARRPAAYPVVYDYRHPSAPLLYTGGVLDAVVVDLPLSIVGSTLNVSCQVLFGWLWLEAHRWRDDDEPPPPASDIAAPSMGDLNAY